MHYVSLTTNYPGSVKTTVSYELLFSPYPMRKREKWLSHADYLNPSHPK